MQENGKFLTAYDLRIGQAITLYGRSIYLYNCDDYTREFYERASQPQGPAESYDNDQWTTTLTNKWVPKKDAQMKDYLEKKLGGGKVNSEKQFLENDRKVLKFYARFEGSPFIVHYFLADDTVEVREVALPNSGKDPFPVTFRRQKLAKNFALNQPGQTYAENFLKAEELSVGRDLHVFGRYYSLEGCDDFTRDYYLHKFNIVFPPSGASSSGKEAPKSSTRPFTQTSSSLRTTASARRRTRSATSSASSPSRPRRTSSSGWTSRSACASTPSSPAPSPRTATASSSSPTTSTMTACRSTSRPPRTPASGMASSSKEGPTRPTTERSSSPNT